MALGLSIWGHKRQPNQRWLRPVVDTRALTVAVESWAATGRGAPSPHPRGTSRWPGSTARIPSGWRWTCRPAAGPALRYRRPPAAPGANWRPTACPSGPTVPPAQTGSAWLPPAPGAPCAWRCLPAATSWKPDNSPSQAGGDDQVQQLMTGKGRPPLPFEVAANAEQDMMARWQPRDGVSA